jgi:uncharacterized RDD family membrane protein YckC
LGEILVNQHADIKTPEYVSIQFQLAGLGSRTAAFIIDQLLLMIVNILILLILVLATIGLPSSMLLAQLEPVALGITIIVLFILNWGYFFAFEFFSGGRTIGKKVLGIRVIQENGHSITLLSSLIRNLMRIIDSLPTGYFLGLVMIFFHSQHKRLGDVVAGTIVVHERHSRKKKQSPLEKEIAKRGLRKEDLRIDERTLVSFGPKDWQLISSYCHRLTQLVEDEKADLTRQIARILLVKLGIEIEQQTEIELENTLIVLFLHLKDEWEFEI